MYCPRCQGLRIGTRDSRKSGIYVIRRRECLDCLHRFTTREYTVEDCNKLMAVTNDKMDSIRDALNQVRRIERRLTAIVGEDNEQ